MTSFGERDSFAIRRATLSISSSSPIVIIGPSVCVHTCGNGSLDPGEECDDRNYNNGDGCSSTCKIEDGFKCR